MLNAKPWVRWDPDMDYRKLPGAMGVYEIANEAQETLYIGKAGGKSPFGIRGELFRIFAEPADMEGKNWTHPQMGQRLPALQHGPRYYRYSVTHQYYGAWVEEILGHLRTFGTLPAGNQQDPEQPPVPGGPDARTS